MAWLGLAWMVEVRTPRHKARTQIKHERPRNPVPKEVQAAPAFGPGCCFAVNREKSREAMVAVGRRKCLCTQRLCKTF
jgi:hypothetical protein